MILCMGRLVSDASPVSTASNGWPLSNPAMRRIAVPELPRSKGSAGTCSPAGPTPCTVISVSDLRSISTPMADIAARVARQSSPGRKPLMSVAPSAIPPSISARCEIDLSPGTVTEASPTAEGLTRKFISLRSDGR